MLAAGWTLRALSATDRPAVEGLSVQGQGCTRLCAGGPESLGDLRLSLEGVVGEGFLRKWRWSRAQTVSSSHEQIKTPGLDLAGLRVTLSKILPAAGLNCLCKTGPGTFLH